MTRILVSSLFACAVLSASASTSRACGGLFCNRSFAPADQSAERVIFKVDPQNDTTRMIVQVSYAGSAEDFAWILPLADVPDADSLATFPSAALTALDSATSPTFSQPYECFNHPEYDHGHSLGCGDDEATYYAADNADAGVDNGVQVHIRKQIDDYEAAVVSAEDPARLIEWLMKNNYNVTAPMVPYIERYAQQGMNFLALRMVDGAEVSDIAPIDLTLPGQSPSIPLRMTALAAEPEMSIIAIVLSDQRYGGANWPNLDIPLDTVPWGTLGGQFQHGWMRRIAEEIDTAGGQGWVTEYAQSIDLSTQVNGFPTSDAEGNPLSPEQQELAQTALIELGQGTSYMTRLHARMSAEEMSSDPIFKRVENGDGSFQFKQLERMVQGKDMCPTPGENREDVSPCEFTTCGAGALCRPVTVGTQRQAGCACAAGTSARATAAPDGSQTVICQDQRLSFVNPGIVTMLDGQSVVMNDPCESFACGEGATCVSVNMTPTCVCAKGMVAIPSGEGRAVSCVVPDLRVPDEFYTQPLSELDPELIAGRSKIVMPADTPEGIELPEESEAAASEYIASSDTGCEVRQTRGTRMQILLSILSALGFVLLRRRSSPHV